MYVTGVLSGAVATLLLGACLLDVTYDKVDLGALCVEAGPTPTVESCQGGADICGPMRNEHCCASPAVPCGSFIRDFDGDQFATDENREATLSDFRLDTFEVTVSRFRAFVEAGQGTQANPNPPRGSGGHPRFLNSGWDPDNFYELLEVDEQALRTALACRDPLRDTWTDTIGDNENKPVNCVTWYEALLFCAWDGGRLPSEAEWYYAAAGGDEQRAYPWEEPASVIDAGLAVFGCPDAMAACSTGTSIAPVGSKENGVARWGHYDLTGNVAEWVLDSIPNLDDYVSPCQDCVRIGSGERGIRGGAFNTVHVDDAPDALLSASRGTRPPRERSAGVGFRCARPVAEP